MKAIIYQYNYDSITFFRYFRDHSIFLDILLFLWTVSSTVSCFWISFDVTTSNGNTKKNRMTPGAGEVTNSWLFKSLSRKIKQIKNNAPHGNYIKYTVRRKICLKYELLNNTTITCIIFKNSLFCFCDTIQLTERIILFFLTI